MSFIARRLLSTNIFLKPKDCNLLQLVCELHSSCQNKLYCCALTCTGREVNLVSNNFKKSIIRNVYCSSHMRNQRTQGIAFEKNQSFRVGEAKSSTLLELKDFDSFFQNIYKDLTEEKDEILSSVAKRLGVVLNYNITDGKKVRGKAVVSAYKILSGSENPENLKLAYVLGWCLELLQGFFIVSDDIIDNSITRRGKPCWFQQPEVGMEAVNDALLLECSIYHLLQQYFGHMESYTKIVNEFLKATRSTVWGQCLDMAASPANSRPKLELFTPSYYWTLVEYKTSLYTFCLPVHLAMHIIGSFKDEHYNSSKTICVMLGKLFQMQDDYLDVYGDPLITGKVGSDIRDGKCTWLAITAFDECSEETKSIMKRYYGLDDSDAVNKILQLYDNLQIQDKYYKKETQLYSEISSLISNLDGNILKQDLFFMFLEAIYKRQK